MVFVMVCAFVFDGRNPFAENIAMVAELGDFNGEGSVAGGKAA